MFRRFSKTGRVALVLVPAALALGASAASAGNVGVDVNLHLGNQPEQVVVPVAPPPARVIVREPSPPAVVTIDDDDDDDYDDANYDQPPQVVVPVAPPPARVVVREPSPPTVVTIDDDVDFVYPARLGFYVAVGVPYDLFYVRNNYYLFRDGRWFRASGSHGPWVAARYRELPPGLRRHDIARIRAYRSAEYDIYRRDRDHYRGRRFMIARDDWKEHRKAEKERWKDARREEKEYQKEMKRAEKEERKAEKEERKRWKHDND